MPMDIRPVGKLGLKASMQGLGCMGMTWAYDVDPAATEETSLKAIDAALDEGMTLLNSAYFYTHKTGATNEALIGKAIAKHGRDKFIISTKFGLEITATGPIPCPGSPANVRRHCEESLKRLGTDYIDLYILARVDPGTPLEDTFGEVKKLMEEGKVKYAGLSECTPIDIRRAHAVCPLTALELEYSLSTRGIEEEILPCARELGIAVLAYSPLCRGLLSGDVKSADDIKEGDFRKGVPRFQGELFEKNLKKAQALAELAKQKDCTAAQLSIAWVHHRGDDVFPIPGSKNPDRVRENAKAASIKLTAEDLKTIEDAVTEFEGDRYPGYAMGMCHEKRAEAQATATQGA